jgi:SulP family sulfate permease
MLGLVALTMAVIWGMPKLTKASRRRWPGSPSSLGRDGDSASASTTMRSGRRHVASIAGGFPALPHFPFRRCRSTFETLEIILPYAVILAAIGLIESC